MSAISPIEDIIEEARSGRAYILVDAEDRENEGDVVIPAQFATPEQINFMARHARGLICLALTPQRAKQLRLLPMAPDNQAAHGTAFTKSIEAREGVSTGISAHDRAHTVAVAIDPTKGCDDIVSPGHIFPLVAKDGGVLVRAGHTEAAVDIARIAGLNPAGVICEVMNDDGSMARLPDLIAFAQLHGLKIGAIADLIAYRRRTERFIERVLDGPFAGHQGDFHAAVYRSTIDGIEHLALTRGRVDSSQPTLVRMHQVDFMVDMLGHRAARKDYIPAALEAIAQHPGAGVAVFIRDLNPTAVSERFSNVDGQRYRTHAFRDYGVGAQILIDLGVRDIILLTSSKLKLAALSGYGLTIVGHQPLLEA